MKKVLALENGRIFIGRGLGVEEETVGEVVFNTGMTGYQEVMTDPSYYGQIVTMTYPLIGNYGINKDDNESVKPHIKGFIVREACSIPSNFRNMMTIDDYLKKNNISAMMDIDTRALTMILRKQGTMKGMIAPYDGFDLEVAKKKISKYEIIDPVINVTRKDVMSYTGSGGYNIGVLDLGIKTNIVRELIKRGHSVKVLPAVMGWKEILALDLDGLMLSNGPGDPKDSGFAVDTIRMLAGRIPIFGICLGHQLAALAFGCDTEKLKYGHRGANHPVKDLQQDRTYITSQNHGYAVRSDTVDGSSIHITHINLNDRTVEGLKWRDIPLFTVQFHPEASPGPSDTSFLFDKFTEMTGAYKCQRMQI